MDEWRHGTDRAGNTRQVCAKRILARNVKTGGSVENHQGMKEFMNRIGRETLRFIIAMS